MPPPRAKPQPEDSRSEASSTKEKVATSTANALNGKGRRPAGSIAAGSSLRDVVTAGPSGTAVGVLGTANLDSNAGVCRNSEVLNWATSLNCDSFSGLLLIPLSYTDIDTITV
jgi:hypothetical protein